MSDVRVFNCDCGEEFRTIGDLIKHKSCCVGEATKIGHQEIPKDSE